MTLAITSVPALIALICKLVLLGYVLRMPLRTPTTRLYLGLLVVFSIQNFVEFVGFNEIAQGDYTYANLIGRLYFAMVIPFLAILLHLSLRLSYDTPVLDRLDRHAYFLYLPAIGLEALLLGDLLVTGFKPFQYSILREPGPLYFLFETYATIYMLAAIVSLFYGARHGRAAFPRTRNRWWLIGLLPIALLVVYLVVANRFGGTRLTSTFYLPVAITLFLVATTYATYQYRLFDVEFFIPWSRVRKRKTAFYKRIQTMITEIANVRSVKDVLDSLAKALRCQVALVGGARPLLAGESGPTSGGKSEWLLSQFPREALEKVDHIVVANEIADKFPDLHRLMKQHRVGAVVPFNARGTMSVHWMLLGEHFSNEVYSPLDFKVVETLFDRIADRFLDDLLLLRAQLTEAHDDLREYKRRLAMAWDEVGTLRKKLTTVEEESRTLRDKNAQFRREKLRLVNSQVPEAIICGDKTLERYLAECEAEIVSAALKHCGGDKTKAARLLGVWPNTLRYIMERHGITSGRKR